MAIQRVILVFPSYGLDDFPESLDSTQSENLHAAITALWHPALLAKLQLIPEWKRADSSALDVDDALVVIPEASADKIDEILLERLISQNCLPVHLRGDRIAALDQIVSALKNYDASFENFRLEDSEYLDAENNIDESSFTKTDFIAESDAYVHPSPQDNETTGETDLKYLKTQLGDFYALGYLVLQVQLLTSKSRYSSTMNLPLFEEQTTKAALAFISADQPNCDLWLQSAFDAMSQERDQYFSADISIVDITLVADSTIGKSMERQLSILRPTNFVVAASTLQNLASTNSENLSRIKNACDDGWIEILGGLSHEFDLVNATQSAWRRRLENGAVQYKELGFLVPKTFAMLTGQFRFWLPSVLRDSGFESVLLQSFTDGKSPLTEQAKSIWKGPDERTVEALSGPACDAANINDLITLGSRLSNQIDYHHAPTLLLVHWPGQTNAALRDLVRVTRRSNALGKWRLASDYFATTQRPYSSESFSKADFSPEASTGHLSKLELMLNSATTLSVLADQVAAYLKMNPPAFTADVSTTPIMSTVDGTDVAPLYCVNDTELTNLTDQIDDSSLSFNDKSAAVFSYYSTAKNKLATALAGLRATSEPIESQDTLLLNPFAMPTRTIVERFAGSVTANREHRIYAAHRNPSTGMCDAIVDVPSLGYVYLPSANKHASDQNVKRTVVANESGQLSNEFLQCQIDAPKNRLAGIFIPKRRGNLLAGQLIATKKNVKVSDVTKIKLSTNNPTEFRSSQTLSGQLTIDGQPICDFTQEFKLARGSRTLTVSLQLRNIDTSAIQDIDIVWRSAWASEAATISTFDEHYMQGLPKHPSSTDRILIDDSDHKIAVTCSTSCEHRRVEYRYLDTVVSSKCSKNSTADLFLAISIDPPQPWSIFETERLTHAYQMNVAHNKLTASESPPPNSLVNHTFATPGYATPVAGRVAYLFSIANRWISCELIRSIVNSDKVIAGVQIRLTNHLNKPISTKMECLRPVQKGYKIVNATASTIVTAADQIDISLKPFEVATYDLIWSESPSTTREDSNDD